jgi:hypothetical protein
MQFSNAGLGRHFVVAQSLNRVFGQLQLLNGSFGKGSGASFEFLRLTLYFPKQIGSLFNEFPPARSFTSSKCHLDY